MSAVHVESVVGPVAPRGAVEFAHLFDRYARRRLGTLDFAWAFEGFRAECLRVVAASGATSVCDVGGGWRPLFSLDDISRHGLDYTVLDVSPEALERTPAAYRTVCADICRPPRELRGSFDVVFSMFVAEHVRDGAAMHRNIFDMLRPGGVAVHVFPTLYHPAFVANKLLPEHLSQPLVQRLVRHSDKFPARYSWCFGPTRSMHRRLRAIGYEVLEYRPFYGTYYLNGVPVLRSVEDGFSRWAARRRIPQLTSFARLQLRKPESWSPELRPESRR
ncbi:MAG: class I SAM-dependent methyltransferase [Candidatus Dormibacteria bacterium]